MKRLLVDLLSLRDPNSGFGEVSRNFLEQLRARRFSDIEVCLLLPPGYDAEPLLAEGFRVVRYSGVQKFLPRLLPRCDLWHSMNQFFRVVRPGVPQILTVHDLNFLHEKRPAKAQKYLRLVTRRVRRATELVVISRYVADDVKRHVDLGGREPLVIYDGVEDIRRAEERRPDFVRPGRPFFFTIGQVRPKKNFHVLAPMMRHFPGYDLFICGNKAKPYAASIEETARREGLSNVFLPGVVSAEEKVWLYRHCAAFLFPSLLEGFGLPVVEAMQFGRPVFISDRCSLPEVAGGHAFIWDGFAAADMAALVRDRLAAFSPDGAFAREMAAYASTQFTYEKHFSAYAALYRRLLFGEG